MDVDVWIQDGILILYPSGRYPSESPGDYKLRLQVQTNDSDHKARSQQTGDRRRKALVQARGPTSVASGWIEVGIELDGSWMELELGLGNGQGMKRPRGLPT